MAFNGVEPMLLEPEYTKAEKLFYLDEQGRLRQILHLPSQQFSNSPPLIVLTGPLLHPEFCSLHTLPWVKQIRSNGQDIYFITHRGHQSLAEETNPIHTSYAFEDIARTDISNAIQSIQEHSGHRKFDLFGAGLGMILASFWMVQNGSSSINQLHLYAPTHSIIPKNRYRLALKVHSRIQIQSLWNYHLGFGALDEWLSNFSLQERSCLLNSNSWLDEDWISTLFDWQNHSQILLQHGVSLRQALPSLSQTSVNLYTTSNPSDTDWILSAFYEQRPKLHVIPDCVFPILHTNFTLKTL